MISKANLSGNHVPRERLLIHASEGRQIVLYRVELFTRDRALFIRVIGGRIKDPICIDRSQCSGLQFLFRCAGPQIRVDDEIVHCPKVGSRKVTSRNDHGFHRRFLLNMFQIARSTTRLPIRALQYRNKIYRFVRRNEVVLRSAAMNFFHEDASVRLHLRKRRRGVL